MDYPTAAHALVQCIAELIKEWDKGTITSEKAGECFGVLLYENSGRACVSTCVEILEAASRNENNKGDNHGGKREDC